MDQHIFGILQRVQAETDDARRADLMEQTAQELGQHFLRNNADFQELAWDMYNVTWRDVVGGEWSTPGSTDLLPQLVEVKTVGMNDTDHIEEDLRGLRVYVQGKGGQIDADIIRAERAQMPRVELVSAIDIHVDDIASDFWGQLGQLQSQIAEKMRTQPLVEVIALLRAAVTSGTNYGSFAAATISDTQFDPVLDSVLQKSSGAATIVGTMLAIRKLANIGLDFGMQVQEKIFQSGTIAGYKGMSVVTLGNFEDFEGAFQLPDDEVWIIGKRAGRVTYYGNNTKVQTLQRSGFYRQIESARDVGFSVYGATKGRIGRVVLT